MRWERRGRSGRLPNLTLARNNSARRSRHGHRPGRACARLAGALGRQADPPARGLLGGVGLAAAALIGCGGDDDDDDDATTQTTTSGTGTTASSSDASSSTTTTDSSTTDDGDGDGDGVEPIGALVQDPDLPYPFNFPEPNKTPQPGGILKVAATWNFQTIDPTTSAAGGTVTVPNMVYNRLVGFKRGPAADVFQPEIEPELAASWERSPDGLTFTFQIDPRARWQNVDPLNGRKFTAADAQFALNRYATEGVHKAYYTNVADFEAVDEETLKVTMARATADFLNPLGSNKQTIFPKELVDDGSIATRAVGTGPMILTHLEVGQSVEFIENFNYWEREVLLDGFEFLIMPDHVARLAQFRVGNIDYGYGLASSIRDLNEIVDTNPDIQVNLLPTTSNGITVGLNHTLEKYQDVRVRRALTMAMDRQEMLDIIFDGIGKALHVIPWPFLFEEEVTLGSPELGQWFRYAPDEAKKLLQAAGAENLEVINSYYAYTSGLEQMSEVYQAQLAEIGIKMTGGKVDYTEFNSQWVPSEAAGLLDLGVGHERLRRRQLVPRPGPLGVAGQPLADERRRDRCVGGGPAGRARPRRPRGTVAQDLGQGPGPDVPPDDAVGLQHRDLPAVGARSALHGHLARRQRLVLHVGRPGAHGLARPGRGGPQRVVAPDGVTNLGAAEWPPLLRVRDPGCERSRLPRGASYNARCVAMPRWFG